MTADREHGTPRGYDQHIRLLEHPCHPCRVANHERYQEWLERTPGRTPASRAALRKLIARHPQEYQELLAAERTNQQGAA